MLKTIIAVPSSGDPKNLKFFNDFEKTLHKFHPDLEVRRIDNPNPNDREFWFRAKPIIANQLFEEGYEQIILADNDQLILGDLSELLDIGDNDIGVVFNDATYPIQLWDIRWPYYNNGLVILKSKEFARHWLRLCLTPHFNAYQFREQDLLNLLCSDYFNYKVKKLEESKIYGEWAKSLWPKAFLRDDKVYIKMDDKERQVCIVHFGGGSGEPSKGNFRIRFSPEVSDFIDKLLK